MRSRSDEMGEYVEYYFTFQEFELTADCKPEKNKHSQRFVKSFRFEFNILFSIKRICLFC